MVRFRGVRPAGLRDRRGVLPPIVQGIAIDQLVRRVPRRVSNETPRRHRLRRARRSHRRTQERPRHVHHSHHCTLSHHGPPAHLRNVGHSRSRLPGDIKDVSGTERRGATGGELRDQHRAEHEFESGVSGQRVRCQFGGRLPPGLRRHHCCPPHLHRGCRQPLGLAHPLLVLPRPRPHPLQDRQEVRGVQVLVRAERPEGGREHHS
mmetsp:Transcript_2604/g.5594  ORF Transcript_2604/g.5594 Transcript_2604/m.5594 type:complete len:206 (+) Transcript_2604:362-979(+)